MCLGKASAKNVQVAVGFIAVLAGRCLSTSDSGFKPATSGNGTRAGLIGYDFFPLYLNNIHSLAINRSQHLRS